MSTTSHTSRTRRVILVVVAALWVTVAIPAQTIRIGSAAPENSPWGRSLNQLAAEWQRISDGRVRVQVFHNSIAGDEADMVRKLRIGQLQAVVMTNTGLAALSDKVMTLSMPLLIRSEAEYNHVFERTRRSIEEQIEGQGFRVLSWSMAGWVYPFSARPVRTPDDLRATVIAASPEEQAIVRAYQLLGYQSVAIPLTERLASLANNMANAYLTVPILAAGFQWFGATPNMLDLQIAPAPGAIIMSERAYRQLPAAIRDELLSAAARLADGLTDAVRELERSAIDTMVAYGLTVNEPTAQERRLWERELEASYDVMVGTVFDAELYRIIRDLLDAYRRNN